MIRTYQYIYNIQNIITGSNDKVARNHKLHLSDFVETVIAVSISTYMEMELRTVSIDCIRCKLISDWNNFQNVRFYFN